MDTTQRKSFKLFVIASGIIFAFLFFISFHDSAFGASLTDIHFLSNSQYEIMSDTAGQLDIVTTSTTGGGINISSRVGSGIFVNSSNFVGIGTTTPATALSVAGTITATTINAVSSITGTFTGTNSGATLATAVRGNGSVFGSSYDAAGTNYRFNDAANAALFYVDATNSRVGVGTASPGATFSVVTTGQNNGITVGGPSTSFVNISPNTTGGAWNNLTQAGDSAIIFSPGGLTIAPWVGALSGVRITSAGNVGIGVVSPAFKLEVSGVIRSTNVYEDTTSLYNLAFGSTALIRNTTGSYNTAIGLNSLSTDTSGGYNTGVGHGALFFNTTGGNNAAYGYRSLYANTGGTSNAAYGMYTLYANTTGSNNATIGYQSLYYNTSGNNNSAVGSYALYSNTTASYNSAVGSYALYSNTTGTNNTALGGSALMYSSTGSSNSAVGTNALGLNTTGSYNAAVGASALYQNTTGSNNAAVGASALQTNTSGYQNSAVGYYTLYANNTGTNNSGIGMQALLSNTTGNYNSAIGAQALLFSTTADGGSAVGYQALQNNRTGAYNSSMGAWSLQNNQSGTGNTAVGVQSLLNDLSDNNSAVGMNALLSNTTGAGNAALGYLAGYNSGVNLLSNSYSTYLGYGATANANGYTNSTALGNGAIITASNQVMLGNSAVTQVVINGDMRFGTTMYSTVANPYLSFSSYFVAPGGAYFSGGTVYTEAAIQARGGIHNDTAAYLSITGGTSGYTYFSGNVGIGTMAPSAKLHIISPLTAVGVSDLLNVGHDINWNLKIQEDWYSGGIRYNLIQQAGTGSGNTFNVLSFNSGNVGIGNIAPAYKLDVTGDINFTGTLRQNGVAFSSGGQWTTSGTNIYNSNTNNVGVGTTNPLAKFQVGSDNAGEPLSLGSTLVPKLAIFGAPSNTTEDSILRLIRPTFSGNLYPASVDFKMSTWNSLGCANGCVSRTKLNIGLKDGGSYDTSSVNDVITLLSDGRVGIGNTSPAYKLTVAGTLSADSGNFYTDGLGNINATSFYDRDNAVYFLDPSAAVSMKTAGSVGIGMTGTPSAPLEVNGGTGMTAGWNRTAMLTATFPTLVFNSNNTNWAGIAYDYSSNLMIRVGATSNDVFGTGVTAIAITQTGNVGIGTAAPGANKLYVNGAALINGALSMNSNNITSVNKLTVLAIDPLYNIGGTNYATYGPSIAGGVKEEYVGRGKLGRTNNLELTTDNADGYTYIIDLSKAEKGSDAWVWYNAVDFSRDNVEVFATPYGIPTAIAFEIEGTKIIFRGEKAVEFSYRLIGKRHDWKDWPTYAKDQNEKPSFTLEAK